MEFVDGMSGIMFVDSTEFYSPYQILDLFWGEFGALILKMT